MRLLRRVIADCQRVNGALWGVMRRDAAMAFMRIGQYLERVDLTCRLLAVRADDAVVEGRDDPYDEIRSMGVLRSLAAYQPFRRAMPTRPGEGSTLEFLLRDEAFPRAAASCLSELRGYLKELPCNEEPLEACTDAAVRLAGTPVGQLSALQLRRFVVELQPMLATIHDRLASTYFHGAPMERAAGQEQRSAPQVRRRSLAAVRPDAADVALSGRRYEVTHRTTYRYQAPAELSHVEAHLRPRDMARQQCLSHELDVEPEPSTWSEQADLFGNRVTKLIVRGHFDVLSVTSTSEVAVAPAPEPPEGPPWESVRTLLERDRQPETRDARRYRAASRLVPTSSVLSEYAQESFAPGRPFVEAVVELSTRINRDFKYEPGFTSVTTPLLEVFEARRGVCQDFAHLGGGVASRRRARGTLRERLHRDHPAAGGRADDRGRRVARMGVGVPAGMGLARRRSHERPARLRLARDDGLGTGLLGRVAAAGHGGGRGCVAHPRGRGGRGAPRVRESRRRGLLRRQAASASCSSTRRPPHRTAIPSRRIV